MPWQKSVLDVALEIDPITRRMVYRDITLTVPRQSGKTTLVLVLILLRALSAPRQNIAYTAQTGSDARKKMMNDWLPALQQSKFADLFQAKLANGHESLRFNNGSSVGLVATTQKAGHGSSLDLVILDESFAHPDARLEQALRPATMTRPQPQFWVVSTAGTPEASPYLLQKVEAGRELADAGVNSSTAYFEWSAEDGAEANDPAVWRSCMPALGLTVQESAVASDFQAMSASEFKRAYLNQWVKQLNDPVIDLGEWAALTDHRSTVQDPLVFAFDVTPDRRRAAIAVAGKRSDGLFHLEVVEHMQGTGWVAERLAELTQKHRRSEVFCDPFGPAGAVMAEVQAAIGQRLEITAVSSQEHGQACGGIFDAVQQKTIRHLGTPELTAALDGAVKRPLGDAWAWNRKSSAVDISPLVAVTIALWGAQRAKPRRSRVVSLTAALAAAGEL